ncbi:uncharacterized protein LOC142585158 [Dermacentor variabilis]|uniref:uncharacterized protein LOC142585158 n=1 Tax=Dermacentor variabilis TaxID=34621 RepID=UPI003F5B830B
MYGSPLPPEESAMEHLENLDTLLKQQPDVHQKLSDTAVGADHETPESTPLSAGAELTSPQSSAVKEGVAVKEGAVAVDESLQGELSSVDMQRRDSVSCVGDVVAASGEETVDANSATEDISADEDADKTDTDDFCPNDIRRKKKKADKLRSSPETAPVNERLPKDLMLEFVNEQQSPPLEKIKSDSCEEPQEVKKQRVEEQPSEESEQKKPKGKRRRRGKAVVSEVVELSEQKLKDEVERSEFVQLANGGTRAFKKLVKKAYFVARDCNKEELAALKLVVKAYDGQVKSVPLAVASMVPKAAASTITLPHPPPHDVVLSHFALVTSFEGAMIHKTKNQHLALTYARLMIKKAGILKKSLFAKLNDYFGTMFGMTGSDEKKTRKTVKCNSSKDAQHVAAKDAPLGSVFDYDSGCPVTVCNKTGDKVNMVRVAHEVDPHAPQKFYIYAMTNRGEVGYAIVCTVLNPLFISDQWLNVLLESIPHRYRSDLVQIYATSCAQIASVKAYLDTVYCWVEPALQHSWIKHSADAMSDCCAADDDSTADTDDTCRLSDSDELALSEINPRERESLFAYQVIRDSLDWADELHELMKKRQQKGALIAKKFAKLIARLRSELAAASPERLDAYKSIAKSSVQVDGLLDTLIDEHRINRMLKSGAYLPSLFGPHSNIYEQPHNSEEAYRTFKAQFERIQNVVPLDAALTFRTFVPTYRQEMADPRWMEMIQKGTAQFVFSLIKHFMQSTRVPGDEAAPGGNDDTNVDANIIQTRRSARGKQSAEPVASSKALMTDRKRCVLIFWSDDEALMRKWEACVSIVCRLHLGNHPNYKNGRGLSVICTYFIKGEIVRLRKMQTATLHIVFVVSSNAKQPTVHVHTAARFASITSIRLVIPDDSDPNETPHMCPRSLVNALRSNRENISLEFLLKVYCEKQKSIANNVLRANFFFHGQLSDARHIDAIAAEKDAYMRVTRDIVSATTHSHESSTAVDISAEHSVNCNSIADTPDDDDDAKRGNKRGVDDSDDQYTAKKRQRKA